MVCDVNMNGYVGLCHIAFITLMTIILVCDVILVGDIKKEDRVELVRNTLDLSQHLLDDIGKILRSRFINDLY